MTKSKQLLHAFITYNVYFKRQRSWVNGKKIKVIIENAGKTIFPITIDTDVIRIL